MDPEAQETLDKAWSLMQAGQVDAARPLGDRLLEGQPGSPAGWLLLGSIRMASGDLDAAREAFATALRLESGSPVALLHLAHLDKQQGHFNQAEGHVRVVLAGNPANVRARVLLGDILMEQGRFPEALAALERVLGAEPDHPQARNLLGQLFLRQGNVIQLLKEMESRVSRLSGAEAEWEQSNISLLFGDYRPGWKAYEARWRMPGLVGPPRDFTQPRWEGEPFPGKTLLVHWEQGLGDTLMFIRYAPLVKARGGRVVVAAQAALAEVVATCAGIDAVIPHGEPLPAFDLQIPLLSLPFVFDTDLASIPNETPYLDVPARIPAREAIAALLSHSGDQVRVGLTWEGNTQVSHAACRQMAPSEMNVLAQVENIAWYSLQFEPKGHPELPGLVDLSPHLKGFSNTAYALSGMDLVITIDTALAHLAGALGIPTLLLLECLPEWRWLLGRPDSPWYPSMHLYRQPAPGDWASVLQEVVRDLKGDA